MTLDNLVYHGDALASAYALYKEQKAGVLSIFPFGIFGYARLDDRLENEPLWKDAPREEGRDPMGLKPNQPNVEFWNTELYGGPKQYSDFPVNDKHAFAMCPMLLNARSRGTVTLRTADPLENPVIDHNYLADPLDALVLAEACQFANDIVMKGKSTKDIVKGSWPPELTHHTHQSREDWVSFVKQTATTCRTFRSGYTEI